MFFSFINAGAVAPPRTDRHRLAGTVKIDGVLGKKLVTVLDRRSFTLVAAKYSDPATGAWEFACLPEYPSRVLMVLALDEEGGTDYNLEAADFVSQVTG